MAAIYRVLAQLFPAAGVETTLYTCATSSVVISSLFITNQNLGAGDTFSVRICIGGAANNAKQLLFAASTLPAGTMLPVIAGLTLSSTDVIKVTSTNGYCSFNLFGQENA